MAPAANSPGSTSPLHLPSPPRDEAGPTLLQKRQQRYAATIDEFQNACRGVSFKCDDEIEAQCQELRMNLVLSYEDSENRLVELEALERLPDGGLVGDELRELTLGILNEKTPHGRQMLRIHHRKKDLCELLQDLRALSNNRMSFIDKCMDSVTSIEARRKQFLEDQFQGMLEGLAQIAYTNHQENAVLAEKATVSMNLSILENERNTLDFITKLKKSELLKQQEYEGKFAVYYAKILEKMAQHVMTSCKTRFDAPRYRDPPHREDELAEIDYEYSDIRAQLKGQLNGLEELSATLLTVKKSQGCLIGGTQHGGWLHEREKVTTIIEEWEESLAQIQGRLDSLHQSMLTKARDAEEKLLDEGNEELKRTVDDIRVIKKIDIQDEYIEYLLKENFEARMKEFHLNSAKEAEARGQTPENKLEDPRTPAKKPAKPTDPKAMPAPEKVTPKKMPTYEEQCEEETQEFRKAELEPALVSIRDESESFIQILQAQLETVAKHVLGLILSQTEASEFLPLIAVFKQTSEVIGGSASRVEAWEDDMLKLMQSKTKNFVEADGEREAELDRMIEAIKASRDMKDCNLWTTKAMDLLDRIGYGYHESFQDRHAILDPYLAQVTEGTVSMFASLMKAWDLRDLSLLEDQEEKEFQALQERHAQEMKHARKRKGSGKVTPEMVTPPPGAIADMDQGQLAELHSAQIEEFLMNRQSNKLKQISTRNGLKLVVGSNDMKVDFHEFIGRPPSGAASSQAADPAVTPTGKPGKLEAEEKKPPAKPAAGKGPKKSEEELEEEARLEEERRQAEEARRRKEEAMQTKFTSMVVNSCEANRLLNRGDINVVMLGLAANLINWMEHLKATYTERSTLYVDKKKSDLKEWKNIKVRDHLRRAPDLESTIVIQRHRELQELSEDFSKQSYFLQSRVSNGVDSIMNEHTRLQSEMKLKLQDLVDRRIKLDTLPAIYSMEVHCRDTEAKAASVGVYLKKEFMKLAKLTNDLLGSFLLEGNRILNKKKASLGNKIDQSQQNILDTLQGIRDKGEARFKETLTMLTAENEKLEAAVAEEVKNFHEALQQNRRDLTFIADLQEMVAGCKGKIASIIQSSNDAEKKCLDMINDIEQTIDPATRKSDIASYHTQSTSMKSAVKGPPGANNLQYDEYPAFLDGCLKKLGLARDEQCRTSRANSLLGKLDDIRKVMYSRALFLAMLRYKMDFNYIDPNHYINPAPATTKRATTPTPKAKPPAKKGNKPTTPLDGKGTPEIPDESLGDGPENWDRFTRTETGEVLAYRIIQSTIANSQAIIKDYYSQSNINPTRPALIPSTIEQCKANLAEKCDALLTTYQTHHTDAAAEFRRQVVRLHVLIHRLPQEICVGIYNLYIQAISDAGLSVRGVWNCANNSLTQGRLKHGSALKGSQSNPRSHALVKKLQASETARQEASLKLLEFFNAFALREETNEAERLQKRLLNTCETLFEFFATMIRPELLIEGKDEISGKHKSLKRLMKSKIKEESQANRLGKSLAKGERQDSPKVEPPLSAKGKAPEKGKPAPGAKGGAPTKKSPEDVEPLPLFEPTVADYNGLPVGEFVDLLSFLGTKEHLAELSYFRPETPPVDREGLGSADKRKKDAKPPAKGAKGAAKKADDMPSDGARSPELTTALIGPVDKIFGLSVTVRDTMYNNVKGAYFNQTQALNSYYESLTTAELEWIQSFKDLVSSLVIETEG